MEARIRARLEGGLGVTSDWVRCFGERGGVKVKGGVEEDVEDRGGGAVSVRSMIEEELVVSGGGAKEEGGGGLVEGGEGWGRVLGEVSDLSGAGSSQKERMRVFGVLAVLFG